MRRPLALTGVFLMMGSLGGCYKTTNVSCPSWALSENPQDQYEAANLVVVASDAERDGETGIFGVQAHTYLVSVEEVLKGDLEHGIVRIVSMPDPCSGEAEYPEGDPLDTADRLIIFAFEQEDEWFTLTPYDGVIAFPEGAEIPLKLEFSPT